MSSLLTQLVRLLAPNAPVAVIAAATRVVQALVEMAHGPGRDREKDVRGALDALMGGIPEWGTMPERRRARIAAGLAALVDFLGDVHASREPE